MFGYCAIGMANSASAPAIVVTIAMTMARRGRSTKMADNMFQLPACPDLDAIDRLDAPDLSDQP